MLFCEEVCVVDKKHTYRSKGWYIVGTLSFQTSLLDKCHESAGKWADDVLRRLSSIDLVASDAIYHEQCESNFLRKNMYLQQRGQKWNTSLDAAQVMQ